jgi:hypothetical protein
MESLTGVRIVPDAKLARYLLNLDHPAGAAKARFFIACGFDPNKIAALETALLMHANTHPVHTTRVHARGVNRVVRCTISTPSGATPCVNTVWTQDHGTSSQRFVTAYPAS